jgi:hypothetical protein
LVIWAVGSILGVTKDVDMVLTRRFDISQVQVLVMNPILIPQSVNVVIGENLYELRFRVELEGEVSNPQPMEMDHSYDHEPDQCKELRGGSEDNGSNFVPPSVTGNQGSQGNPRLGSEKGQGAEQGAGHRPVTFVLQLLQGLKVLGAKRSVVGSEEVHSLLPDGGGGVLRWGWKVEAIRTRLLRRSVV